MFEFVHDGFESVVDAGAAYVIGFFFAAFKADEWYNVFLFFDGGDHVLV